MPRRLFLALLLLVAAPMVLLGWMSAGAVRDSENAARETLANLLSSQLYDADQQISQRFENYAGLLDREFETGDPIVSTLRRLRREVPIVRQGIVVDKGGVLLFPTARDSVGIDAAEVAASIPGMIDARPLPNRESDARRTDSSQRGSRSTSQRNGKAALPTPKLSTTAPNRRGKGLDDTPFVDAQFIDAQFVDAQFIDAQFVDAQWQQWYMADGAQVVYWKTRADGVSIGVLLERSRWIADLIAALPDDSPRTIPQSSSALGKIQTMQSIRQPTSPPIGSVSLVDEAKRTIYRWGDAEEFNFPPLVTSNLSPPLASWQLRLHVDPALLPTTSPIPLYLSLGGIALIVLAVGFYVLTSVQRQIAEAKSRVSFAGQVSHELRTPLTNIRLYTELAESDLGGVEPNDVTRSLSKRLEVIDHESRRLQRLVSGVLEMIRPSGSRSGVRSVPTDICELVKCIAQQFAPSFQSAGLSLETRCEIAGSLWVDPDVVEMVLVNLLSNVEKYVPRGGQCWIECDLLRHDAGSSDQLQIIVADDGPGIGTIHRSKVFRPFERLDDSVSAPSGTGIGLTIARRAARRHDGDLVLLSQARFSGAAFQLTLPINVPAAEG